MGLYRVRGIRGICDAGGSGGVWAGNRLKGEGGGSPLPTALTLPQRHSHSPTPAPTAFATASNRPPTAFTSPATALQPLWDCPDGPPPLQAKPWVWGVQGRNEGHLWCSEGNPWYRGCIRAICGAGEGLDMVGGCSVRMRLWPRPDPLDGGNGFGCLLFGVARHSTAPPTPRV